MIAKYVVEFKKSHGGFGRLWVFGTAYSTKKEATAASLRMKARGLETRIISMTTYQKNIKR